MKHPKDDDRELKHADGTDIDADLRWVHFDYLVNKYKMERQNKYEQLGEQLDKLWHDIDDGKLGADAKTGTWFAAVKAVKDEFPKN